MILKAIHTLSVSAFPPDVLRAQSEDMARMFEWFDFSP